MAASICLLLREGIEGGVRSSQVHGLTENPLWAELSHDCRRLWCQCLSARMICTIQIATNQVSSLSLHILYISSRIAVCFHCHKLQEEQEIVAIKDKVSIFFGTEILPALVTAKSCGPLTVVCMCKIEKESGLFLEIIVC
jgi:hypothetical protein